MPNNPAPRCLFIVTLALLPACSAPADAPADDTSGASSSESSSPSTSTAATSPSDPTTDASTTEATTTTDATIEPTTAAASSSEDSGSTDDGESSSDDEGETTSAESSSDAESSSSGGLVDNDVEGFYGDCANASEDEACNLGAGESCIFGPGGAAFCTVAECVDASDCAAAPSGDAETVCAVLNDGIPYCYLSCMEGETCPDGMACVAEICAWTLQAPGGGMCPDGEVASELPQMHSGTNAGLFDDVLPSCNSGGEDALLQFIAPQDGTYRFTTAGSDFDTILMIIDGCDGEQLACNDDAEGLDLQSSIEIALVAEQSIVIAIDGFGGETGEYDLDISLVP